MKTDQAIIALVKEYSRAIALHPTGMRSAHEGFAILKEEVDELWDEVKKKQPTQDIEKLKKEALQVGAMALRFLVDII